MQQRNVAVAAGGLILLALVGFSASRVISNHDTTEAKLVAAKPTTCQDTYRVMRLRPSDIATATPNCVVQSLQVSGELHGSVAGAFQVQSTKAETGNVFVPAPMCAEPKRWQDFPQAQIAFVIGGKAYRLTISPAGTTQRQSVHYNAAGKVDLAAIADPTADWNQATGTFSVDTKGVTGIIDAELLRDVAGAKPVHISGQWACGAPPPLPAFDASQPCSNFYALNHLGADDVARMKSSGCHSQNLDFAGDVLAHVSSAVTDAGGTHRPWLPADNMCGFDASGERFYSTLKFSLDDETFLLEMSHDGVAGPGQYDAHSDGQSIGVVLFIGQVDSANQGLFVDDTHAKYWAADGGSFTVASDMRSGTVDAELREPFSGSRVHASGSWRCAA